jgi:GAF domain-containing protein
MAEVGRLRLVTAGCQASGNQELKQNGPDRDAYDTGEVVRVTDVGLETTRWPEFSATALSLGVAGMAGMPMRLDDQIIGTLKLYSAEPREWADADIAVAGCWPTWRPATWSTPPSCANRNS